MVQNLHHSGTLRAMSESIPAIDREPPETDATGTGPAANVVIKHDLTANGSGSTGAPDKAVPALPEIERQAGGKETGGPEGPEPTRFGDWERKGRCIDF